MVKRVTVKEEDGEIDLSMLELQDVPVKQIDSFKKAHTLDLSNNSIVSLPVAFPTLVHITKLNLSGNSLKQLPENFGNLIKLKYLDLYQNKLEHLPLSFSKLSALRWLDVKDNPLVPALAKVAGQCLDAKQCQKCALDVVKFFVQLQVQVNAEKEMKDKHRKRQLEINQQKEKEKKKAKNKENKAKTQQNNKVAKDVTPQDVAQKVVKNKSNTKTVSFKEPNKFSLFHLCFKIIFFVSLLFALTSIKITYLKKFELLVVDTYFKILQSLPKNFQIYGIEFGHIVKQAHIATGEKLFLVGSLIRNNEYVNNLLSKVVNVYKDIFK